MHLREWYTLSQLVLHHVVVAHVSLCLVPYKGCFLFLLDIVGVVHGQIPSASDT